VAIVSMRYGDGFAGGAEWSLRRMATALCLAGHGVEVFTTCTRSENDWKNDLPAGTSHDGTTLVHRFRLGPHDRGRHLDAVRAIHEASGKVPPEIAQAYLDHSLHSPDLIEALRHRQNDFAAIIVGPYLFGLTWDVAREFPGKTLLVPCFHDEPIARLAAWPEAYESVAGILYHSREEQELAQTDLGLNHPHSLVIGTWLSEERGSAGARSALRAPALPRRYVVYCGRYSAHKELPKLLDYARCYYEQHPDRFTFVFMGQGEVAIPAEPWARDLGYVSVEEKSRVLADAAALIQLSYFESLSLVALEAWSAGTPIIAAKKCAVLAGHIASSGGGQTVTDYTDFAAAVDDLWNQPAAWKLRGLAGQDYVRATYGSLETFQNRLWEALAGMDIPLAERMRQQGLKRAALFRAAAWREQFSNLVEKTLDAPPLPQRHEVEIVPYQQENRSSPGGSLLIGVRLTNRGTHALLGEGPGLTKLCCQVRDGQTQEPVGPIMETPLPGILPPGQATPAAMALQAPEKPGSYQVVIWTERPGKHCRLQIADCKLKDASFLQSAICNLQSAISLVVDGSERNLGLCAPLLEAVQAVLAQAHRLQRLPDDYIDVSEGFLARCKRWLKRKLLNNFKRAYVDVLSRQQTQVNQQLVHAVQELAQCCASLDHAVRVLNEKLARLEKGETGTVVIGETALESGKPAKE
jgi:glycosyltransferase involved in cell wall biosynthesis